MYVFMKILKFFTGTTHNYNNATIKFYIDGDVYPSIEITLLELAMIGRFYKPNTKSDGSPWGH
jgi:hypothetical protein